MSRLGLKEAVSVDQYGLMSCAEQARQRQDLLDLIGHRLYLLEGRDRLLLELVFEKGSSYRQIAGLLEMRESSISRRVRTLIRRLLSREYQVCLHRRRELSPLQMSIARERFVLGMGRRSIARRHRISVYRVDLQLRRLARLVRNPNQQPGPDGFMDLKEGV